MDSLNDLIDVSELVLRAIYTREPFEIGNDARYALRTIKTFLQQVRKVIDDVIEIAVIPLGFQIRDITAICKRFSERLQLLNI